jgi:hypothetical protein
MSECMLKGCEGEIVINDNTHLVDGGTCNKCNSFYPEGTKIIYFGGE